MAIIDIYSLTDSAIAADLGQRFKALRLRRNITQKELADAARLSLNTIKALEAGQGKLSSLIAVLRELNALDQLDFLLPEPGVSPLEMAKRRGKTRERATGERGNKTTVDDAEDGEAW